MRLLLPGWQAEPIVATFSDDRKTFLTVWDFAPPAGSEAGPLRLTFINYELDVWGEPSGEAPSFWGNFLNKG